MWGCAFAVCVMQSLLTCQFEHSGKVRSGLVSLNLALEILFFFAIKSGLVFSVLR